MPQHSIIIYSLLLLFAMACSTSGRVDTMLLEAESLMMEHPDSALAILNSISPSQLTSDRQRADYALLLTQAHDKNFRFETDDSLISTSVAYFDEHPEPRKRTLAHMYRGILNLYRGNLTVAIKEALTALDLADRLNDDYIFAKTHELIADIYVAAYNFDKAITHRRLAADYYLRADKPLNNQYALVDLAREYIKVKKPTKSISILDSLSTHTNISDSIFQGYFHASYIYGYTDLNEYNKALENFILTSAFWQTQSHEMHDRTQIADMFSKIGILDSAEYYLDREKQLNPNWNESEEYHWAKSNIYVLQQNYQEALTELHLSWGIHNNKVVHVLKNNVAYAENDFNKNKSVIEKRSAEKNKVIIWLLIGVIVTICIAFIAFYRERMKRKHREIEIKMLEAQELLSRLDSSENNACRLKSEIDEKNEILRSHASLINQLFRDRYTVLNNLSNEYFEKRDSALARVTIIKDFENEIAKIKKDDSIEQLKDFVDQYRDNILSRMRQQLPRFKEADITFCALLLAGFAPRTICLLINIQYGNYYNKWTRIRARISNSDAPDKDFFLNALNKSL